MAGYWAAQTDEPLVAVTGAKWAVAKAAKLADNSGLL